MTTGMDDSRAHPYLEKMLFSPPLYCHESSISCWILLINLVTSLVIKPMFSSLQHILNILHTYFYKINTLTRYIFKTFYFSYQTQDKTDEILIFILCIK